MSGLVKASAKHSESLLNAAIELFGEKTPQTVKISVTSGQFQLYCYKPIARGIQNEN